MVRESAITIKHDFKKLIMHNIAIERALRCYIDGYIEKLKRYEKEGIKLPRKTRDYILDPEVFISICESRAEYEKTIKESLAGLLFDIELDPTTKIIDAVQKRKKGNNQSYDYLKTIREFEEEEEDDEYLGDLFESAFDDRFGY